MYCVKCGKNVPDDAAFCTGCGAKMQPQQAAANPGPAAAPVPPVQQPVPPVPPVGQAPPPPRPAQPYTVQPNRPPQQGEAGELISLGQYLVILLFFNSDCRHHYLMFIWGFSTTLPVPIKRTSPVRC